MSFVTPTKAFNGGALQYLQELFVTYNPPTALWSQHAGFWLLEQSPKLGWESDLLSASSTVEPASRISLGGRHPLYVYK